MSETSCPKDLVAAYAEWMADGMRPLGAHVRACPTCAEAVERLRRDDRFAAELRAAADTQLDSPTRERLLSICMRAQSGAEDAN
jgi:hypothetical protein